MSGRFSGVVDAIGSKRQLSRDAGSAVAAGVNKRLSATDMVHPLVTAGLGPDWEPVTRESAMRDLPLVEKMAAAERGEMSYEAGTGEGATPIFVRDYQREDRNVGGGYLNNPLEQSDRAAIAQQFWEAPLGGHVRGALEGQEVFGHRITGGQARMAEQGLAGLTAVGVGVPAFMAAVQQLSTPADQNTIPF